MSEYTFLNEYMITSLTMSLTTSAGTTIVYPVKVINLEASVGVFPVCTVIIMQGIELLTGRPANPAEAPLGSDVKVEIVLQSSSPTQSGLTTITRTLMGGKLGATNTSFNVGPSGLQTQFPYQIQTEAAFLDSIPLGDMYFVSEADGSPTNIVKSAFQWVQGGLWSRLAESSGALQKPEVNLAEATARMMDFIGADRKTVAPAVKLMDTIDTSTCPEMAITFNDLWPLSSMIEAQILQLIGNNVFYEVFNSIIQSFYLVAVPNFHDESGSFTYTPGSKMKIVPLMAWMKSSNYHFNLKDIISSRYSIQGKGRNEVDGIAVKYTSSPGGLDPAGREDLLSTAVYAEGAGDPSGPRLITDYEELRSAATMPSKRILTIPLPYFVSFGMANVLKNTNTARSNNKNTGGSNGGEDDGAAPRGATETTEAAGETGWAKSWAEIIAQATFAATNRSRQTLGLVVPFKVWLDTRHLLGQVVSASLPRSWEHNGMLEDATDNTKDSSSSQVFGLMQSWHLSINLGGNTLSVTTSIGLSHVRTAEDNSVLGIEKNLLYNVEGGQNG